MDTWLDGDWQKKHEEARDRRLQMPGVPHHQGSRSLSKYAKAYVSLRHCSNLAALNSASFLTTCCCLSRSRMHTVASQLVNSRHMLWLTWARRRPTSSMTQMPRLRRTPTPASTPASLRTWRQQGQSMGRATIREPRSTLILSS